MKVRNSSVRLIQLFTVLILISLFSVLLISCESESDQLSRIISETKTQNPEPTTEPIKAKSNNNCESGIESIKQYSDTPPKAIDPAKDYTATIEMAKGGVILIELYAKYVPDTVNNFVFLAKDGFYDCVTFHRVIPGFMAQTGDPTGSGSGGPGYRFEDEFNPKLRHDSEGILSMANAGPNTNGSQFFITFAATPHLDGAHTVFGKVIEGMDVVKNISVRDPSSASTPGDAIRTITIVEK